jgi:hypothetical protein
VKGRDVQGPSGQCSVHNIYHCNPGGDINRNLIVIRISVADPDPFDTDPDHAVQFDMDPDSTVRYGSGSLQCQRGNVHKTVLFIHLSLSVGPTEPTQKVFFVKFSLSVSFVVLTRVAYGSGSRS